MGGRLISCAQKKAGDRLVCSYHPIALNLVDRVPDAIVSVIESPAGGRPNLSWWALISTSIQWHGAYSIRLKEGFSGVGFAFNTKSTRQLTAVHLCQESPDSKIHLLEAHCELFNVQFSVKAVPSAAQWKAPRQISNPQPVEVRNVVLSYNTYLSAQNALATLPLPWAIIVPKFTRLP